MEISNLPKLLYIGDVSVESTLAGSALLYRLLQKYPVSKLCIVEGNIMISQLETRLERVKYEVLNIGNKRLINSRLNALYSCYLFLTARQRASQLVNIIKNFQPEAILTVADGFSWLTAAELAKRYQLPLHLIVHDDLPSYIPVVSQLKDKVNEQFAKVYRQAKSKLCVSPYMVECYQERYGVIGSVLYPSRAADFQEFDELPLSKKVSGDSLTFAYAGSINSQAYSSALVSLASTLKQVTGNLLIYSPLTQESIASIGLNHSHVITHPLIPSNKLIKTLKQNADVLFVPMSFETQHKLNMQLSFPSKLTDYTAIGLPLLIWGPAYCSAVRWAKENPGVAEIVETENTEALRTVVEKLHNHPEYRRQLSVTAIKKGKECFGSDRILQQFYQSIGSKVTV